MMHAYALPQARARGSSQLRTRMRRMSDKLVRIVVAFAISFAGVSIASMIDPDPAHAAIFYSQVDNKRLFNEGYYLNQRGGYQAELFTEDSFKCTGGHMVRLKESRGYTNYPKAFKQNIYEYSNIWPELVGEDPSKGIEAWGFVCDSTCDATGSPGVGASVEMRYTNVGTIESSSDPTKDPIEVDIVVKHRIAGTAETDLLNELNDAYGLRDTGKPVIQFTDCFSYGMFQFGITGLESTYTFYETGTNNPVEMDSLFYTKTSMDKGEGFFVDYSDIKKSPGKDGIYVSCTAPATMNPEVVDPVTRYQGIQGTHLYWGAHSGFESGTTVGFSGMPPIFSNYEQGKYNEYKDTIGDATYYWRSACVLIDMNDDATLSVMTTSVGNEDWETRVVGDSTEDPTKTSNYGYMFQTVNFLPITNVCPKPPKKTINGDDMLVGGVSIGDTLHYEISQQMPNMGNNSVCKYASMVFSDKLPEYVELVEGSIHMLDPHGVEVPASAGSAWAWNGEISYIFDDDYLNDGMEFAGGNYTLVFDAIVTDQPDEDFYAELVDSNGDGLITDGTQNRPDESEQPGATGRVPNKGTVTINEVDQTTNIVWYEPVEPVMSIEKHAVINGETVSALEDYQYLLEDEGNPHSTVHFEGSFQNVADGSRAKNVTVSDMLPNGLALVPGSVRLSGFDGTESIHINETANAWAATIPSLDAGKVVSFSYDCTTTSDGNGTEVINSAHVWATNCAPTTPGNEDSPATDDGEIYINDPSIVIDKTVSESPIQNADYQSTDEHQREEYRSGDTFSYKVVMNNSAEGTYAHDVWLVDDEMPAEFELVGDVAITGFDYSDQAKSAVAPVSGSCDIPNYPFTGETDAGVNSDTTHGETKTVGSSYAFTKQDYSDGKWGWALHLDYLPHDQTVTVEWTVKALPESNGWEVCNQAYAIAANQPRDTFLSSEPIVWINTPEFVLDKHVTKSKDSFKVGDNAKFQVELEGLATPGTLARHTTLQDVLKTDGVSINELSAIKVYDQRKNARNMGDDVMLYACSDETAIVAVDSQTGRPYLVDDEGNALEDSSGNVIWLPYNLLPSAFYDAASDRPFERDPASMPPDEEDADDNADGSADSELSQDEKLDNSKDDPIDLDADIDVDDAGDSNSVDSETEPSESEAIPDVLEENAHDAKRMDAFDASNISAVTQTRTQDHAGETDNVGAFLSTEISDDLENLPEELLSELGIEGTLAKWHSGGIPIVLSAEELGGGQYRILAWHEGERERYDDGSDQSWHIDMTQAFGDSNGYWVCDYDYRYVWKDGELSRIDGERNPVGAIGNSDADGSGEYKLMWDSEEHLVKNYSYMKVEYQATIDDTALENMMMHNDATVNSIESRPVTDRAAISILGPQLSIDKSANDGGSFEVGDIADYEINVSNNATDTTAVDVKIADGFSTAKAGAVEIVDGSVELFNNLGMSMTGWTISWRDNEAGNHIGFELDTNLSLSSDQKLTLKYKVKYLSDNGSSRIVNTARAWANNAPEVQDDHETWPSDVDQSPLKITKGSDKRVYQSGQTGSYALRISNESDSVIENVVIHDALDPAALAIARIEKGSVALKYENGEAIAANIVYLQSRAGQIRGFDIETGKNLEPDQAMLVEYKVAFDADGLTEAAQTTNIHNDAWAAGDNAGRATTDHDVLINPAIDVPDPENPDPDALGPFDASGSADIVKDASSVLVDIGGKAHYTITVQAGSEGLENAVVRDAMDKGLMLIGGSVRFTMNGKPAEFPYSCHYKDDQGNTTDENSVLDYLNANYELEGYDWTSSDIDWSRLHVNEDGSYGYDVDSPAGSNNWCGEIVFQLGNMEGMSECVIDYDCLVDPSINGGTDLFNTAILTADNIDEIADDAKVSVGWMPEYYTMATENGTYGRLGKTGDPAFRLLMLLGGAAAVSAFMFVFDKLNARRKDGLAVNV